MNETGSYPGQPWLWLYTLWYQVPGWSSSANVDMIAVYMTGLATLLLLCVPFIPGLRDVPRLIPVHRLVWRRWSEPGGDGSAPPAGEVRPRRHQPPPASPLEQQRLSGRDEGPVPDPSLSRTLDDVRAVAGVRLAARYGTRPPPGRWIWGPAWSSSATCGFTSTRWKPTSSTPPRSWA